MKKFLSVLFFCFALSAISQKLTIRKGVIIDSIQINDSIPESFSLFLPKKYNAAKQWPVVFVFDMAGKGNNALKVFKRAAEEQGYILAASNNTNDTLSTSQNILVVSRMLNAVATLLPIKKDRIYTAGFSNGARLASITPIFIKNIKGVISCGAGMSNVEVLVNNNPFYFIGIVGKEDYNYRDMLRLRKGLNIIKFPNQLLVFDGGQEWPPEIYIREALQMFTLSAMSKKYIPKDTIYVEKTYEADLEKINKLVTASKFLEAEVLLEKAITVYRPLASIDTFFNKRKIVKKEKLYKSLRRNQRTIFFNEDLIKEEYTYALDEDISTYNFNNLGWWSYQIEEINKRIRSKNMPTQQMGKRLLGYVNDLVRDTAVVIEEEPQIDEEALLFLWMLKTIISPKEYIYYLKVISNSAKNEDFGTAFFYLEELLKNGYEDKTKLYNLEHTALLKITPEFNAIVAKHLKAARYDIDD